MEKKYFCKSIFVCIIIVSILNVVPVLLALRNKKAFHSWVGSEKTYYQLLTKCIITLAFTCRR